ncbi:MAG: histidine phosphatase family protein [Nocardioidaceae bacterium]
MSDLFCAASVIVARHGEAEYDAPVASDDGGSLTLAGRRQARQLGEWLRDRKVAAIWSSDMSRAVQTAEIAAAVLGVPVRVRPGLREFAVGDLKGEPLPSVHAVFAAWMRGDLSAGCPGAETGYDVLRRFGDEMESLVDQFRGETVLVVSHGGAIGLSVPQLAVNVPNDFADGRLLEPCETVEALADADGWMLTRWADRTLPGRPAP